jgi:hypothetical protein
VPGDLPDVQITEAQASYVLVGSDTPGDLEARMRVAASAMCRERLHLVVLAECSERPGARPIAIHVPIDHEYVDRRPHPTSLDETSAVSTSTRTVGDRQVVAQIHSYDRHASDAGAEKFRHDHI